MMEAKRKRVDPHITWAGDYCKHCFTCINICPVKNLKFKRDEMTSLLKCIQCQLCEKYCPDFALEVEPKQAAPGKAGKTGARAGAKKATPPSKGAVASRAEEGHTVPSHSTGSKTKTRPRRAKPQKAEGAAEKAKPGAKA